MTAIQNPIVVNGTPALVESVKGSSERSAGSQGSGKFRLESRMVEGERTRTTVIRNVPEAHGISRRPTGISIDTDSSAKQSIGAERLASPVEHFLSAVASDVTASISRYASEHGIGVGRVSASLDAEFDPITLSGVRPVTPDSCRQIRIAVHIHGEAPVSAVQEAFHAGVERSVVFQLISERTPVIVGLAA